MQNFNIISPKLCLLILVKCAMNIIIDFFILTNDFFLKETHCFKFEPSESSFSKKIMAMIISKNGLIDSRACNTLCILRYFYDIISFMYN